MSLIAAIMGVEYDDSFMIEVPVVLVIDRPEISDRRLCLTATRPEPVDVTDNGTARYDSERTVNRSRKVVVSNVAIELFAPKDASVQGRGTNSTRENCLVSSTLLGFPIEDNSEASDIVCYCQWGIV